MHSFSLDSDDVARRFTEKLGEGGVLLPTFAGQLARRMGHEASDGLIDFAVGGSFDFIPLQHVLEWLATGDAAKLQRTFRGKVILLGGVFRFEDRLAVPVNLAAWDAEAANVPGVLVHAQALRNFLNDGLITPVPTWAVLVLCLVAAMLWFPAAHAWFGAVGVLAGGATLIAVSTWGLTQGWYLPPTAILITLETRS